jgi:light-regulated signal transduction histidine kinase (bacteriophytochrome)
MSYPAVDLTNCDKEPIHILGKVQSHGFLFAVDRQSFRVTYVSENLEKFTGISYRDALNRELAAVLEQVDTIDPDHTLISVLKFALNNGLENFNPVRVTLGEKKFNLILHTSGNNLVLEFEEEMVGIDLKLQAQMGASLSSMLGKQQIADTLEMAARQIKELIGYDRVMIYKFWDDGHGEVVAEARNKELEAFLGLHYPASDIPRQARELYKINLTRIIADVDAVPSEIFTLPGNDQPLDLTHSALRAVSTIHIEYLKNMGVMASFSVSLLFNNELWGLIACHNYSPKFIDYRARQYAKLIGQILSSSLQSRITQAEKEINLSFRRAADEIVADMHRNWNLVDAVVNIKNNLLKVTSATGAALVFEGKIYRTGETPNEKQIIELTNWLQATNKKNLFHCHNLPEIYTPAQSFKNIASGLLACAISKELGEYVLFFKPELITTVKWAGDPSKPVEINDQGQAMLSPRRSFEVWAQEVTGTSEKWTSAELNTIFKFREDIFQFINLKANEIRKLNEKLKEAYDELDTFSFTISHDLKTPIASIKNYSEILLEDNLALDDQSKHFLRRIVGSADKMNVLIREVLGYSRVSRQQLNTRKILMAPLIEELKNELIAAYKPANLEFTVGATPDIIGDKVMITQVFSNLLGNAIKYSAKANPSKVRVAGKEENGNIIYSIADNGVGIDMEFGSHIFELFKRMENVKDYEGSGVGLAIVKRIMEKHNARIWYESESGNGTIFYLSFQKDKS